jgi:ABC-type transport system involved in Fe-S cluster assembly fused permease/ATPase subunit
VDVREQSQQELRGKIGFVPQKAVLFTGTIAQNIRYGKPDATDEEIRHAADVAQATDFILEMKDGFDATISQGGGNVSGDRSSACPSRAHSCASRRFTSSTTVFRLSISRQTRVCALP